MNVDEFSELTAAWWLRDFDAADEVDRITREQKERLPSLIRALVESAPDGALSYIGVTILEDLADFAVQEGGDDPSLGVLIAAKLTLADTFEILSGPYPHYLQRWGIREHLAKMFSVAQFDALEDWEGRRDQRLILDGDGVRLVQPSTWFGS